MGIKVENTKVNTLQNDFQQTAKKRTAFGDNQSSSYISNDSENVRYTITSDASKENEAQKSVEEAKKNNVNLKQIVSNLIAECDKQIPQMAEIENEMNSYGAEIEKTTDENGKVTTKAKSKVDDVRTKMQEQAKQIKEKQQQMLKNELEMRTGRNKEDKTKENAQLKSEIKSISAEYQKNGADITNIITESRAAIGNNEENIKHIAERASDALTKAINANEYAEETINKGYEAVSLKNDTDTLNNNGYSPYLGSTYVRSSSSHMGSYGYRSALGIGNISAVNNDLEAIGLGNGKNSAYTVSTGNLFGNGGWHIKYDFQQHIKHGNEAIAKGSKLGEAAETIANQVKSIGSRYDFAIGAKSEINKLANKSYYNTDILDKVNDVEKKYKDDFFANNIIQNAKNEANASVADKVVAERKKAEEEAKKAQQ